MDCKTNITRLDADWVNIKNECRTTVNKEPTENKPSADFKIKLLISEHSPIRLLRVQWRWSSIKSWVATHFARHWMGWQKWIGTRRFDRTGIERGLLSQEELVPMDVEANAQALINVAKVRLCRQAAQETRLYMEDLKRSIHAVERELAEVMVPSCIYRGGCPEFQPCNVWRDFCKRHPGVEQLSLRERYGCYNADFYGGLMDD